MDLQKFTFNVFRESTMVLSAVPGDCVVVDPGFSNAAEKEQLYGYLREKGLNVAAILVTHAHYDHTVGISELQKDYGCPVYLNDVEKPVFEHTCRMCGKLGIDVPVYDFRWMDIKEGCRIDAAGFSFKVLETPGHTRGSVCFLEEERGFILTGDTLFAGTIGRTDMQFGNYDDIIVSIMEKLMVLDGGIRVYPGHGPDTTIARERLTNPFLEPFNEKEESNDEN